VGGLNLEALLQGAAQILATVSGCITLITMPQTNTSVDICNWYSRSGTVMLLVTDAYETQSALMELPKSDENAIWWWSGSYKFFPIFEQSAAGAIALRISRTRLEPLDREFQRYGDLLKTFLTDLTRRTQPPAATQIMIRGVWRCCASRIF